MRLAVALIALVQTSQLGSFVPPTDCQPATAFVATTTPGQPEARAGTDAWALLFNRPPFKAGAPMKIAWHIAGTGSFVARAYSPGGRQAPPDWLEPHGASNWDRPGNEWGTGFTLPSAGCWDIHVSRGSSFGDVWIDVAAN
jgi:hypothetical protein